MSKWCQDYIFKVLDLQNRQQRTTAMMKAELWPRMYLG